MAELPLIRTARLVKELAIRLPRSPRTGRGENSCLNLIRYCTELLLHLVNLFPFFKTSPTLLPLSFPLFPSFRQFKTTPTHTCTEYTASRYGTQYTVHSHLILPVLEHQQQASPQKVHQLSRYFFPAPGIFQPQYITTLSAH